MILYLVQIALGTQVREAIDSVAVVLGQEARDLWIGELGIEFYIHRTYSLVLLALHLYMAYLLIRKWSVEGQPVMLIKFIVILIAAEILTGALMAYFAIPAILQPLHLLVASLIFGAQFYLYCISTQNSSVRVKVS